MSADGEIPAMPTPTYGKIMSLADKAKTKSRPPFFQDTCIVFFFFFFSVFKHTSRAGGDDFRDTSDGNYLEKTSGGALFCRIVLTTLR